MGSGGGGQFPHTLTKTSPLSASQTSWLTPSRLSSVCPTRCSLPRLAAMYRSPGPRAGLPKGSAVGPLGGGVGGQAAQPTQMPRGEGHHNEKGTSLTKNQSLSKMKYHHPYLTPIGDEINCVFQNELINKFKKKREKSDGKVSPLVSFWSDQILNHVL